MPESDAMNEHGFPSNHPIGSADLKRLVVVLPVYNEADSISAVLGEVAETASRLALTGVGTSVVLVDDESPDGTAEVAIAFAEMFGIELSVIRGTRSGLGMAMLRGLEEALKQNPDAIVTLDGDGQHNPADIPTLHRAFVARKADIVIGSRWVRGGRAPGTSFGRSIGSRLGNSVFRLVSGARGVADATTSFRIYSPRVVRFLLDTNSARYGGYSFFSTTIALAEAAGYTISEVPIEFRPRYGGQSKLNRREVWRYFSSLPSLRNERRQTFATSSPGYLATEEIEWLNKAVAWNRYVVDSALKGISPNGVSNIIEVGAGVGAVTAELTHRFPLANIWAYEPDPANFEQLCQRFLGSSTVHPTFGSLLEGGSVDQPAADLVIYVNVLEHIREDAGEITKAAIHLRAGGQLSVFVPALSWLYGPIDARSGHFRRYSSESLAAAILPAGFVVDHIRFVDRLGVVPYWLNYRLLNRAGMPPASAALFDRVFVPLTRKIDGFVGDRLAGKNIVCIARLP